jgi:hypothetical protein
MSPADVVRGEMSSMKPIQGRRLHRESGPTDLIQVVLDDASVERLREAASGRGIEVEQLMVQLLHLASFRIDEVLGSADSTVA